MKISRELGQKRRQKKTNLSQFLIAGIEAGSGVEWSGVENIRLSMTGFNENS